MTNYLKKVSDAALEKNIVLCGKTFRYHHKTNTVMLTICPPSSEANFTSPTPVLPRLAFLCMLFIFPLVCTDWNADQRKNKLPVQKG